MFLTIAIIVLLAVAVFTIIYVYNSWGKCKKNVASLAIVDQNSNSLQIVNDTRQDPLHVFLETRNMNPWSKIQGSGKIYPSVDWTGEGVAWNPVAAHVMSEIILRPRENIILNIPSSFEGKAFIMMAVKFRVERFTPLSLADVPQINDIVYTQQFPVLIEGGKDVVADASGVDGINFKMTYELTTSNGKIEKMQILKNPCQDLPAQYQLEAGCVNPAKKECVTPTCDCCEDTQKCKFNECSVRLFDVPGGRDNEYYGKYDCRPGPCSPDDHGKCNTEMPVKRFINDESNVKKNTPLDSYCSNMHADSGDFTTYCYDYNDTSSSPWLSAPYKMKIVYRELDA